MASGDLLTTFQEEKLQALFNFFAQSEKEIKLTIAGMDSLYKKIVEFTGWTEDSTEARRCKSVVDCFFESMLEKVNLQLEQDETAQEKEDAVSLENWFRTWSNMLQGTKALSGLPIWVKILPTVLLEIIDRDGDGVISFAELKMFYQRFLPKAKNIQESWMLSAYNKMTDTGAYPLDINTLSQLFSNFLIGRTPFSPGKYLFGCFDTPASTTPKVKILRDLNEEKEDLGDPSDRKICLGRLKRPEVPRPRRASLPSGRLVGS